MHLDMDDVARRLRDMSDEELLSRCAANKFTQAALPVAHAELASRGLAPPQRIEPEPEEAPEETPYEGDYVTVAQFLNPMDAQLMFNCLQVSGIPVYEADANLVQTNSLWTIALGGIRIRVPSQRVEEAREVIAAFNRGDFALRPESE